MAELSVVVETGLNPAGKQEYTSCGIHDLNSEGTLKYATDGKPGFSERKGYTFQVEVPVLLFMPDFLGPNNLGLSASPETVMFKQ